MPGPTVDPAEVRRRLALQAASAPSVRKGTSTELDAVTMAPVVIVEMVDSDEVDPSRGGRGAGFEARTLTVTGYLLVARAADSGRAINECEPIVAELFEASRDGVQLGLAYVEDAALMSAEMGDIDHGDETWLGARLTWLVKLREEGVSRSAAPIGWAP